MNYRHSFHAGNFADLVKHALLIALMETPDDFLICIDARTGKEIWHKEIADFELQYFSTMAPIVIGNHIIVGTGNDLDEPGFVASLDPETGEQQWKFYTVPGDPSKPFENKAMEAAAKTWGGEFYKNGGGGAVFAYDAAVTSSDFVGNSADAGSCADLDLEFWSHGAGVGGGLFVEHSSSVRDARFSSNRAAFLGGGAGFTIALTLLASVRERVKLSNVPDVLQGTALTLMLAGILSLSFMGFAGLGG